MLQAVFEPVVLRFESNQHTGRFAMTRNDDLLRLGLAKMPGRSSWISERGTPFTPDSRTVRAMAELG
jgi:hypothetical protein